ncbi:MAG: MBL fold metallo-hydrolase, partial [Thermodesulfobacteriota bacterium]
VASHTHPDHAGGVGFFRKHLEIPVAAPSEINSWYSGFRGFIQHKIDIMLGHYVAVMSKFPFRPMYYPRKTVFDYGLGNGSKLPFFDDWTVFSSKGHTSHDVVFFNEKESILYAADVILKVKNRFYLPIPVTFPNLMKKSLGFIYSLQPGHIFLAHGGYMEGKLMEKAYPVLLNQADIISKGKVTKSPVYRLTSITPEIKKYKKVK